MEYIEILKAITLNLEKCRRVTKHSTKEENQSDTLANALIDISEAMKNINVQVSKLYLNTLQEDEVDEIILEIGEELRHILYHINDTHVFNNFGVNGHFSKNN